MPSGSQWSLSSRDVRLCAGYTYNLTVSFTNAADGSLQKRWALLEASFGSLGRVGSGGSVASLDGSVRADPGCPNRLVLGASSDPPLASIPTDESKMSASYNLTLTLPCNDDDASSRAGGLLATERRLVLTTWSGCPADGGGCDNLIIGVYNVTVLVEASCTAGAALCGQPAPASPPPPPQAVAPPAEVVAAPLATAPASSPSPQPPAPPSSPAPPLRPPTPAATKWPSRPPTFPPRPQAPPATCQPSSLNYACSVVCAGCRGTAPWTRDRGTGGTGMARE
ncbi:hypothetical protein PLESTM_000757200 [Pleodorina starrii]|nr:hypothetical protein PLESTM_000757200 [Pleodorina starrii]